MAKTIDEIAEKLEVMKLQSEVLTEKASQEQIKAMIKELKKKYGRNWRKILNIRDSETLRQFANVRFRLV